MHLDGVLLHELVELLLVDGDHAVHYLANVADRLDGGHAVLGVAPVARAPLVVQARAASAQSDRAVASYPLHGQMSFHSVSLMPREKAKSHSSAPRVSLALRSATYLHRAVSRESSLISAPGQLERDIAEIRNMQPRRARLNVGRQQPHPPFVLDA